MNWEGKRSPLASPCAISPPTDDQAFDAASEPLLPAGRDRCDRCRRAVQVAFVSRVHVRVWDGPTAFLPRQR